MKQPNLKARLISSVLVLVMMITSLLGTTFAWFTDLAVSGGNTIQVGSLKVGLYHKVGEDDWKSIKDNSNHKIFNYDKWEPGYTRFETLKIANLGNLALHTHGVYCLTLVVVLTQRVAHPVVSQEKTAHIGVVGKMNAEKVVDLTLV